MQDQLNFRKQNKFNITNEIKKKISKLQDSPRTSVIN